MGTERQDIDDLVQDCINSTAKKMMLLQSYTKPSMCTLSYQTTRLN